MLFRTWVLAITVLCSSLVCLARSGDCYNYQGSEFAAGTASNLQRHGTKKQSLGPSLSAERLSGKGFLIGRLLILHTGPDSVLLFRDDKVLRNQSQQ